MLIYHAKITFEASAFRKRFWFSDCATSPFTIRVKMITFKHSEVKIPAIGSKICFLPYWCSKVVHQSGGPVQSFVIFIILFFHNLVAMNTAKLKFGQSISFHLL